MADRISNALNVAKNDPAFIGKEASIEQFERFGMAVFEGTDSFNVFLNAYKKQNENQ